MWHSQSGRGCNSFTRSSSSSVSVDRLDHSACRHAGLKETLLEGTDSLGQFNGSYCVSDEMGLVRFGGAWDMGLPLDEGAGQ